MSASPKDDSVMRSVSAILAAIKKTADCRSIKLSSWRILDTLELLRECQPGCLKGVAPAKNPAVGKTTVSATGQA